MVLRNFITYDTFQPSEFIGDEGFLGEPDNMDDAFDKIDHFIKTDIAINKILTPAYFDNNENTTTRKPCSKDL